MTIFSSSGVEEEGMGEGAMVEVEEGMEVEDMDQSRTLTSRLRLTSTTVVSLTHLVEGPTKATVRTREREGAWLGGRELLRSFSVHCRDRQCSAAIACIFPPTCSQKIAWCP